MFDLILVGGGLANGLLAFRLQQKCPDLRILVLEQDERLGGNHTWSFYSSDLSPAQMAWIEPLIEYRWPRYEVRFPRMRRCLPTSYQSLTSAHFHTVIAGVLGSAVRVGTAVSAVQRDGVLLANGEKIAADGVIDGRGFVSTPHLMLGYQKFTGQILRLKKPHRLRYPIIMDADVPQRDGYRFVYTLPLSKKLLLIENTGYTDGAHLDRRADRNAINEYAESRGWQVAERVREEAGVLPIALAGEVDAYLQAVGEVPTSGLRALLFHATTGYSFAYAVRLADHIASLADLSMASLQRQIRLRTQLHWREQSFFRFLNRMLFLAAEPRQRWRIMRRFYGLRTELIERFYAGRPTFADKVRILTGKPPIGVAAALRCLRAPNANKRGLTVHDGARSMKQ